MSLYTVGAVLVLGATASDEQVGHFALAQQVFLALQVIPTVLVMVVHPVASRTRDVRMILRLALALGIFGLAVAGLMAWGASTLVHLLVGSSFDGSGLEFPLLMIAFGFTAWSTMLGYPFAVAIGAPQLANRTTYLGALVFATLVSILHFSPAGMSAVRMAAAILLAEVAVALSRLSLVLRWRRSNPTARAGAEHV